MQKNRVANAIHHVVDGEQALDYLFLRGRYTNAELAPRPQIILLDLRLPKVDGLEVRSTVSIGVAVCPEHDAGSMETLLRYSDTALYRAKRAGRDRVVPYATRDQEPVRPIA